MFKRFKRQGKVYNWDYIKTIVLNVPLYFFKRGDVLKYLKKEYNLENLNLSYFKKKIGPLLKWRKIQFYKAIINHRELTKNLQKTMEIIGNDYYDTKSRKNFVRRIQYIKTYLAKVNVEIEKMKLSEEHFIIRDEIIVFLKPGTTPFFQTINTWDLEKIFKEEVIKPNLEEEREEFYDL